MLHSPPLAFPWQCVSGPPGFSAQPASSDDVTSHAAAATAVTWEAGRAEKTMELEMRFRGNAGRQV